MSLAVYGKQGCQLGERPDVGRLTIPMGTKTPEGMPGRNLGGRSTEVLRYGVERPIERPCLYPFLETSMQGRFGTKLGRDGLPLGAGAQQ